MRILILLLVLFFVASASAQKPFPCGTPAEKSPWLKNYQKNTAAFRLSTDTILYVPMTIHSVGTDEGTAHFLTTRILDAFCTLNEDMAASNIQFFIEGEINFINNTALNQHDTVIDGAFFMFQYNVANTLNTYFVTDPAGNCGYNLPYAGVMMNKSCSNPDDHTWAHEVGHALSLPHPFYGWEGGISWDNSVPPVYSEPAPERVLANYTSYKDSLITDTLIIDTIWVEKVDRSNCTFAADGFCDTPPDYIAQRWTCNSNSESPIQQTDPDGVKFQSDGTLIMSYSDDMCANRFSAEQTNAMRANLLDEKQNLLYNQIPKLPISNAPVLLEPAADQTVAFNQVRFAWKPAPEATHYLLQVSRLPNFPIIEYQATFTDTTALVNVLQANRTYYWRVRPFNSHYSCAGFTQGVKFQTSATSSTGQLSSSAGFFARPTLISRGQPVEIIFRNQSEDIKILAISDAAGRLIFKRQIQTTQGSYLADTQNLSPGIYFFVLENASGRFFQKVVVR